MTSASLNQNHFYTLSEAIVRQAFDPPYGVPTNEPKARRTVKVFALDPSLSRYDGSEASIQVPVEDKLNKGPCGSLFIVDQRDSINGEEYLPLDLDDRDVLMRGGLAPDRADTRFHAQMVYSIALLTYENFRKALGRYPTWAFHDQKNNCCQPLTLVPFGMKELNAYYSPAERRICFGYSDHDRRNPNADTSGYIFTSLSSDIIAHEVSHALLDGLKPHLNEPTNPDVLAFHEAFCDLVALFQRFTFEDLVREQLRQGGGKLSGPTLLRILAPELGAATGSGAGLRTFRDALERSLQEQSAGRALDADTLDVKRLEDTDPDKPHARGRVLAEALFDAFQTVLNRKLSPLIRLANRGSDKLPAGEIPEALLGRLVHDTRRTASQFLSICIRALDYCPPVHIEFGDYIRALITADTLLVRDDPHGYREAVLRACALRGIHPRTVNTPSESSLLWHGPSVTFGAIPGLSLTELNFNGDPAVPRDGDELKRQACCFGDYLAGSARLQRELGLAPPDANYSKPEIVSIRSSRRIGPDDQAAMDLIIEVVQARTVEIGRRSVPFKGGATVILDPYGRMRYIVRKRVDQQERAKEMQEFLERRGNHHLLDAMASDQPIDIRTLCFTD